MPFSPFTSVSLLLFCSLWDVESREYVSTLTVKNGGRRGEWGKLEFCSRGYASGFALKVAEPGGILVDDTALNAIALHCPGGEVIRSSVGPYGKWTDAKSCKTGFLSSFSLRMSETRWTLDYTGANNIKFKCTDGTELEGLGIKWGKYDKWSESCNEGGICGIQTKVMKKHIRRDDSGLNDVKFFCCA